MTDEFDSEGEWTEAELSEEENRKRMVVYIARAFVRNHGEAAIMMAMAEMLDPKKGRMAANWREVVNEIERIQKNE